MSFDFIDRKFAPKRKPKIEWEEGGDCPECGAPGAVELLYPNDSCCSCHINPPCGHCASSFFACSECGEAEQ